MWGATLSPHSGLGRGTVTSRGQDEDGGGARFACAPAQLLQDLGTRFPTSLLSLARAMTEAAGAPHSKESGSQGVLLFPSDLQAREAVLVH